MKELGRGVSEADVFRSDVFDMEYLVFIMCELLSAAVVSKDCAVATALMKLLIVIADILVDLLEERWGVMVAPATAEGYDFFRVKSKLLDIAFFSHFHDGLYR